jgi:hypothetical protein
MLTAAVLFLGLQAWWILTPTPAIRSGPRIVEIPAHRGFLDVAVALEKSVQIFRVPAPEPPVNRLFRSQPRGIPVARQQLFAREQAA